MKNYWNDMLEDAKTRYPSETFDTWFVPMTPELLENGKMGISVPNEFFRDWIVENYVDYLNSTLSRLVGTDIAVSIKVKSSEGKKEKKSTGLCPGLAENYTFDNFVDGASNNFARSAALAIVDQLGTRYNPLLIYSRAGLGKTHLATAIGHELYRRDHTKKILYVHAEKFVNELVAGIRFGRMQEFRDKYRSVDLLLIDDIQFIKGNASQEEFFSTFNTLYETKKQIVMTCDKFPSELLNLEDRLKSRFQWGLTADIAAPEFEHRIAILEKKAMVHGVKIAKDISEFIATNVYDNIRSMEGALLKLLAYSSFNKKPLSIELAASLLKDHLPQITTMITVDLIQRFVADHFNIRVSDLKSQSKVKNISVPRQIALYLSRKYTDLALADIGTKFGGKDHSTVIYSVSKIAKLSETDERISAHLKILEGLLKKG